MARTTEEIQQEILAVKDSRPELNALNSTSKTSIWRLIVFVIATVINTLEQLFDLHKKEVNELITTDKPHTLGWYRTKALLFQDGFDLIEDSDLFNNGTATDDIIEASKVVKYAAVTESATQSRLILKITGEVGGVMQPLPVPVLERFKTYINEVKDAGVDITIINYQPDKLRMQIKIIRDKLVIADDGTNIISGTKEVEKAVVKCLKELPFNGGLSLRKLTDYIQQVEGVLDVNIDSAETSWIDSVGAYATWETVYISKIPASGYFAVDFYDSSSTAPINADQTRIIYE